MTDRSRTFEYEEAPPVDEACLLVRVPSGIRDTQTLLKFLYEALQLPGYFGFNWNALSDCLRDFHWLSEREIAIAHADVPRIPTEDLRSYLDTLRAAQRSWGPNDEHLLRVIFPADARAEVETVLPPA